MFDKEPSDTIIVNDLVSSTEKAFKEAPLNTKNSETVNTVEKISGILSPYFIVVVGLYIYESNFLIGITLITIGIISLLKVSGKDVIKFINWLKHLFGFEQE